MAICGHITYLSEGGTDVFEVKTGMMIIVYRRVSNIMVSIFCHAIIMSSRRFAYDDLLLQIACYCKKCGASCPISTN